MGLSVYGLGFRVLGVWFMLWDRVFGVEGSRCGVQDLGILVLSFGFGFWGLGFRVVGSGLRVWVLGFRLSV